MRMALGPLALHAGLPRNDTSLVMERAGGGAGVGVTRRIARWAVLAWGSRWVLGFMGLEPMVERRPGPAAVPGGRVRTAAVANAFAAIAADAGEVVDGPRMHGLVYAAHAWHLAVKGTPLIDESVAAMPWGPTIRSLMRGPGLAVSVARPATTVLFDRSRPGEPMRVETPRVEDAGTRAFLEDVYAANAHLDGVAITEAACGPGEPWSFVKAFYDDLGVGPEIPDGLIAVIFAAKERP